MDFLYKNKTKTISSIILFFCMLPAVWGQLPPETQYEGIISTQGYSAGTSEGYEDDGYWGPEPIGFTFTFFGNNYTDFYFTSNGLLMFGTGSTAYSNYDISNTSSPNNYIAPFWDDIMIDPSGVIYYKTIGTAPNRKLIVQWTNMTFYGANTLFGTFQVILYEGSNDIQMQYRNIVDMSNQRNSGSSATIGLENSDGSAGVRYSYNTADVIEPVMAIRWTPSGSSYTYDNNAIYEGVVLVEDITVPEPGIPSLTTPSNNSVVGTDVAFQWESAEYADSYKHLLWEGSESNTIGNADIYDTGTNLSYDINGLTLGQDYKWAVFSVNSSGETWSEIRSFTTSDAPPLVGVPKTYYLEEDGQAEVKLEYTGGDATGKTGRVTTMPPEGELYQYDNGSKGPQISSVPTDVTDMEYRLIYVATNGYGNDHGTFNFEFQDDTYTSDEASITINVSPPGVPVLQDVAFNTNIIELQFDRALNPVAGKESQFSAKLNGTENIITSINLKEGDPYSIIVNVQDAQTSGDTKEISYTQGDVSSTGGGLLQSFSYQIAVKQSQTITFTEIPDKTYGDSDFTLNASATSGLPVSFVSSNSSIISITGSTASINGSGTVTITAKQDGDAVYESAKYLQEVEVLSPEIYIEQAGTQIADGGSFNFGSHIAGSDTDMTFTIGNTGEADLKLSGTPIITLGGTNPDQFTVQQQPTSPVTVSGTSSFVIRFSPDSGGDKSATVSIDNNDVNENPYDITFTGTGSVIAPTITTQPVTDIAAESATGNGNITDLGVPDPDQHGVCWNTTGVPDITDSKTEEGPATVTGAFTSGITGLSPNTSYYVRAYATNSAGTVYGSEETFSTTKKELSIDGSFTVNDKIYDGNTDAVIASNNLTIPGVVGSDDVNLDAVVVEFASADVSTGISVSITSAGLSGADADNYTLTLAGAPTATADILAKELTVTADDKTKIYGDANPTLTFTYSGFVNGDDATVLNTEPVASTVADETSDVGSYAIELSGGGDNNYAFNYIDGTLTINKATLMANGEDKTKIYGEANPSLTFTYSGFENGDDATVLNTEPVASTVADETSDVGSYAIELSGGGDNNYAFNYTDASLTVTKATLAASGEDKTKIYGEANPSLTFTYSGFVNGDDATVLDTEPAASTVADETSDVGSYAIELSGGSDNNYAFNYIDGTLTVNKATLMASGEDKTKIYGEANPSLTFSYSGFVNGDDATVLDTEPVATTVADETSNVGSYAIELSGGSDNNYAFSYTDASLTVTKATLTASGEDKTKIYGEANPPLTFTYSGFVNGDDATVLDTEPLASTVADETSDVGSYAITLSGGSDNNYAFSYTDASLTVTKATLAASGEYKTKIYGEVNPPLTFTYSGFVNGDDATVLDTEPVATTVADETSDVGSYAITVSGGNDNNYAFSYTDASLTVTKATLAASGEDKTKIYGEANPPLTFTYSGFVNGDDATVLDTEPVATTVADETSNVGSYAITVSGGNDNNYAFSYTDASLTVTKATLAASGEDKTKIYGEANPPLTFTYSGFVNGDDATVLDTEPVATTVADETSDVGSYAITVSGGNDNNYAFSYTDASLTVTKATLTASGEDKTKIYGEANPSLTFTYSGFVNGDDATVLDTEPVATTVADETSNVGSYAIELSGGSDNNYAFNYIDGTLTVNKATLMASGEDKTKIYGDANPPLTFTYSGFVNGDDATVLDTEPAASTVADETSDVGSYAIELSGGSDNNYAFSYTDASLTVTKATLTVTADDKTKICGEPIPELTISYSGFVNDDDSDVLDNAPIVNTSADASSDKGSYDITVSGGNDHNYEFIYVDGILTVTNTLPVIESSPEETTKVGYEYFYQLITYDPDDVQTLTYNTDQLPLWLTFDEQTQTISGTPMSGELGEHEISITVNDGFDQVSQEYTLVVTGGGLSDDIHPDIKRPEAFSPNGDGYNDHFVIEGLENYPNNSLFVYNRWGNKVFQATPYKNDWDGQSTVSMAFGKDLTSGTYYYILDLGDGSDIIKGYIYIQK